MTVDNSADPRAGQVARVETLLAAVRDLTSSLRNMSTQLERDVMEVIETGRAGSTGGSGRGVDRAVEQLRAENLQLKEALEGRAIIERAKGVLMATGGCDEEAAFQMLVSLSRQERRKVREIAVDVVTAAGSPKVGDRPGLHAGLTIVPATRSVRSDAGESPTG